jgi:D-xylose transport system ATP-binding protein
MGTGSQSGASHPLLRMDAVSMTFPGVRALDRVSFDLRAGEVHALVGENGAGKSTLMKILGGVYASGEFEGELHIEGARQRFSGIRDAERAGVAIVFQELSLAPELSVAENIFLGRLAATAGFVRWGELQVRAQALLDELGAGISPAVRVCDLGIGQRQLVEIAKALSHQARILILDEPTAALNDAEAAALFRILEGLRQRGLGIAYISHRIEEVLRIADRITILRDGKSVATRQRGAIDRAELVSLMVGRPGCAGFQPAFVCGLEARVPRGDAVLVVNGLTVAHPARPGAQVLSGISFSLHAGEVLGIAGLMGSGRTALLNVLFGSFPAHAAGEIRLDGKAIQLREPRDAIRAGIALVPEDRKSLGLSLGASIAENMTLVALREFATAAVLHPQRELAAVERAMADLRVKAGSAEAVVGTLSGGNQQKVVLGKWLLNRPRILLLDEPTRGIDIAAKQEIYARIDQLASQGLALIVVSSELEELRGICDRILVLHEGRMTGMLSRTEATPERIMACATGSGG